MTSINEAAASIVKQMVEGSDALNLAARKLKNGTLLLDAGVEVKGSFEAGRLFALACMGGLGEVWFTRQNYGDTKSKGGPDFWLPAVEVSATQPDIAFMASQYAGWAVKLGSYFAIGSGPARALYAAEEIYGKLNYKERSDAAVLMLEGRTLPDEEVADFVAQKCGVAPDRLAIVIAPTASLVGSVQIAARSAETGMHKLSELGFDVHRVTGATGMCPLAPVGANDLEAIGRTNDAILYGSRVFFTVQAEDRDLEALISKIPSESSQDYGVRFQELCSRYNGDFYQIDRMLFSPAEVEIMNVTSGKTYRAGHLNPALLRSSLLGE
jgi:methenyltetrahydromethanopterin cyclohydrolase